jgi:hypothetical protein
MAESILVITPGSPAANSFDTLDGISATLAAAPFDTSAWDDDIETDQQEQVAIFAALAMDFLPWRGYRVYENQALCCPRTHQSDVTIVPGEVKEAQAYIAFLGVKPAMAKIATEAGSIGKAEVKSVSLEGLVSMTFASEALERQGGTGQTSLIKLMLSREFPIWFKLARHLRGGFRVLGLNERPELLPEVEE